MSVHVISDTRGEGVRALLKRMESLKARVLVGVPAGKAEADGTSMALVAAANEFGVPSRGIPERSFLRAGIREGLPKLSSVNRSNLKKVVNGEMTEDSALGQLGLAGATAVKKKIVAGPFQANAPSTIAQKNKGTQARGEKLREADGRYAKAGVTRPLIDTDALRQSITFQVDHGGAP